VRVRSIAPIAIPHIRENESGESAVHALVFFCEGEDGESSAQAQTFQVEAQAGEGGEKSEKPARFSPFQARADDCENAAPFPAFHVEDEDGEGSFRHPMRASIQLRHRNPARRASTGQNPPRSRRIGEGEKHDRGSAL